MKHDAFLLDCDGVLLDSNEIKIAALAESLTINGHEPSFIDWACREFRSNFGRTRPDHFRALANYWVTKGNRTSSFSKEHALYSELVERDYSKSDVINENFEIMKFLRKNKEKVFIVSASDEDSLKDVISEKIGEDFRSLVLGGPITKVDHIKRLIVENTLQHPVFFGDAKQDLDAARECGIDFIGLSKYSAEQMVFEEYCVINDYPCFDYLSPKVIL